MYKDMRVYRKTAIEVLNLDPQPDLRRWFLEHWNKIGATTYKSMADETIDDLMRGKHKWQPEHLDILHRVLTLHEYDLSSEETWRVSENEDLVLTETDFRALLMRVRSQHKDPLHLLNRNTEDRFSFEIDLGPAAMPFHQTEPYLKPTKDRIAIPTGTPISFRIVPQAEGRVLVLSRHVSAEKTSVLNEFLDRPRAATFPAYKSIKFPVREASGEAGDRDLIAINWPARIEPDLYDLSGLFERKDLEVTEQELRRLSAAVAATRSEKDDSRVWASVRRLRLE